MSRAAKDQAVLRFGVSMEQPLLAEFDAYIRATGFANRSEAIRDLIRKQLGAADWECAQGQVAAVVAIFYSTFNTSVNDRLASARLGFEGRLLGLMDISLGETSCLEIFGVQGTRESLRDMLDRIRSVEGVQHAQSVMVPLEFLNKQFYSYTRVPLHIENPMHRYFDEMAGAKSEQSLAGLKLALASLDLAGKAVLDAGCGCGCSTEQLLSAVRPGGRVVAVDFAERAIEAARARVGAGAEFRHVDVLELDLPDNSVDVVVAHDTFSSLLDQSAFLRTARRVLRKGGKLVIVEEENPRGSDGPIVRRMPTRTELLRLASSAAFGSVEVSDGFPLILVATNTVSSSITVSTLS